MKVKKPPIQKYIASYGDMYTAKKSNTRIIITVIVLAIIGYFIYKQYTKNKEIERDTI